MDQHALRAKAIQFLSEEEVGLAEAFAKVPGARTSPDERAAIVAALRAPLHGVVVAHLFGRSPSTISRIARRHKILLEPDRSQLNKQKRAAIIAALKLNPNARQIGRQIKVSHVTVGRIARKEGIRLRRGRRRGTRRPNGRRSR